MEMMKNFLFWLSSSMCLVELRVCAFGIMHAIIASASENVSQSENYAFSFQSDFNDENDSKLPHFI